MTRCAALDRDQFRIATVTRARHLPTSCAYLIASLSACQAFINNDSDFNDTAIKNSCCTCNTPPTPGEIILLSRFAASWYLCVRSWSVSPRSVSRVLFRSGATHCVELASTLSSKHVKSGLVFWCCDLVSHHRLYPSKNCGGYIG